MSERLPFGPLREQVERGRPVDDGRLASILGCSRRSVLRYKRDGIPMENSDRLCVNAGLNPEHVWRDWL